MRVVRVRQGTGVLRPVQGQEGRTAFVEWRPAWRRIGQQGASCLLLALLVLTLTLGGSALASAERLPVPPCKEASWPVPAPLGASPNLAIWHEQELEVRNWRPPGCTGWPGEARSRMVAALAGHFSFPGNADALLSRLGAVSTLRGVRYWSSSDQAWRPLVLDASALAGADMSAAPRPDFTARELADGGFRHYMMRDSRSGRVVYRQRVLERRSDRLVLLQENVSPVRSFGLTLFEPGALQTVVFLDRQGEGLWQLYLLTRMDRQGSSALARGHEASLANRAQALFRHLAGIPTDQEPPAVR